ncbi:MAG TPA: carboxypeptidase-like regulatory domain-containing protein [Bryobacteraceae bacterium]|nr:carboxypeptidase-like regulatory domain-containing protein [Bryobacteraceae bacterium]
MAAMAVPACAEEIAGRIVQDDSGAPVASAEVRIEKSRAGSVAADAVTDGEGRFSAPGLAAGEYMIAVEKAGFMKTRVAARVGSARAAVTIRLVRLGAITGRVTDQTGQSRRGARVMAMTRTAGGTLRAVGGTGTTASVDSSGRYRLYGLPPGEYAVAVSDRSLGLLIHPSNAQPEFFTVAGGEEHRGVDFSVMRRALFSISGKVELPAPGAVFSVALALADQPGAAIGVTPTSADGSFRIEGVPQGSYYLFASGPVMGRAAKGAMLGSEPMFGRMRLDVSGDHVTGITLAVGNSPRGTVQLRAERGGAGACPQTSTVAMTSLEDWAAMLDRGVAATFDKEAEVPHLAPGRYQLTAAELGAACYQTADAVLDLTGGGPGRAVIPVAAAGSIRGVLTGGSAEECAVVLLAARPAPGRDAVQIAVPDAAGRFVFGGLPPGDYRIAVRRASEPRLVAKDAWLTGLHVPGGVPTDVELPAPPPSVQ